MKDYLPRAIRIVAKARVRSARNEYPSLLFFFWRTQNRPQDFEKLVTGFVTGKITHLIFVTGSYVIQWIYHATYSTIHLMSSMQSQSTGARKVQAHLSTEIHSSVDWDVDWELLQSADLFLSFSLYMAKPTSRVIPRLLLSGCWVVPAYLVVEWWRRRDCGCDSDCSS